MRKLPGAFFQGAIMRGGVSIFIAGAALLLSACDQNKSADVKIRDKDGNVTISANGQHLSVQSAGGKNEEVTISANSQNFSMRANDGKSSVAINANGVNVSSTLPGFVTVYPGAKVTTTAAGEDSSSTGGTLVMETKAAPSEVIAFYKQKSEGAGFRQTLNMDQGGTLVYAATSGARQLQVLAAKTDTGTHAQVTWSGK